MTAVRFSPAHVAGLLQAVLEQSEFGHRTRSRAMLVDWLVDTARRFRAVGGEAADVSGLLIYAGDLRGSEGLP
ncbi:MAG TPA: hypothetical protein VN848_13770 [Gemmatimonadales bacterium]|nr:hypothetical protein [Gemmatimonadales bacterium]